MSATKTWTLWMDEKINEEEAHLLRRRADELPVPFDEASRTCIDTLVKAFLERDDAVGLAAPQIGMSRRIIVFRNKNFDNPGEVVGAGDYEVLINPRITQSRGDKESMKEGCLSCPDISVDVSRSTSIKVKAYDGDGNKINKRYTGYLARVVQHEIDHLDGTLIVDRGTTIYFPREKKKFFEAIFSE